MTGLIHPAVGPKIRYSSGRRNTAVGKMHTPFIVIA